MNQYKSPILSLLLGVLLFLVTSGNLMAQSAFVPDFIVVDEDSQDVYQLEYSEFTFNKQSFYRYRLWQSSIQTGERKIISWLGTKILPLRQKIVGMVWDRAERRLILVDAQAKQVFALDPNTKKRTLISGSKKGTGAPLEQPGELIIDSVERRLIVIDQARVAEGAEATNRVLTQIELDSGNRTLFHSMSARDINKEEYHLTFDPTSYQLFLSYGRGVLAIDLYTNEGRSISDSTEGIGQGPLLIRGEQITFDYNRHRLMVTEPLLKRIMGIDIATGERHLVVDYVPGVNQTLCWPRAIAVIGDTTLIADSGHRAWLGLDLAHNQWSSFPEEITEQTSDCGKATIAELNKLLTTELAQPTGEAVIKQVPTIQLGGLTQSLTTTDIERLFNKFFNNVTTIWKAAYSAILQALLRVEGWFLGPFIVLGLLLVAQFYYLALLVSSPFITLIGLFGKPSLAPTLFYLEAEVLAWIVGIGVLTILSPLILFDIVTASVIASAVTVPYIPFAFLQALLLPGI